MRKYIGVTASLALLLALVGCTGGKVSDAQSVDPIDQKPAASTAAESEESADSSQESQGGERQNLEVAESGYWVDKEWGKANYAIVVNNPNMGWAVEGAEISITGKDADGNVVGNETTYLTLLYSNGKTAVCGSTYMEGIETLDFEVIVPQRAWIEEPMQQAEFEELFYAEGINETTDEYESTTVAGTAVNKMALELSLASANVVFRDADGGILGGAQGYIDTIAPESTGAFSVDYIDGVPEHSSTEVYLDCGTLIEEAQ